MDATCDPPETFTFGRAVSHVVSGDAHRYRIAAGALRAHGVGISPDPIAWERSQT